MEAHAIGSPVATKVDMMPPQDSLELVLCSDMNVILEDFVHSMVNVLHVDEHWGEVHEDPGWKPPKLKYRKGKGKDIAEPIKAPDPFPKYLKATLSTNRGENPWFVRRMIVGDDVVPLCHTHPIRAELELMHFGRHLFEEEWDQTKPDVLPVISFPHIDFIDGFGVFRNSCRSLMGFYFTPAGLSQGERLSPGSIFPIVLGVSLSPFSAAVKLSRTVAPGIVGSHALQKPHHPSL